MIFELYVVPPRAFNALVEETPSRSKQTKLDSGTGAHKRPARTPPEDFH